MARKPMPEKAPKARFSGEFVQAVADLICNRLAEGESLRKICGAERDAGLPGQNTVYKWLAENEAFAKHYASARESQGDTYADRAVDEALTATDAALGRLRMDALKWAASKLAPKKYGDKLDIDHSGGLTIELVNFAAD